MPEGFPESKELMVWLVLERPVIICTIPSHSAAVRLTT